MFIKSDRVTILETENMYYQVYLAKKGNPQKASSANQQNNAFCLCEGV